MSLLEISVIQMENCIASRCLWAVAILNLRSVSALSQCRILSISTHSCSGFFLPTDNLHLLDCLVTWSLLSQTDTDWTCWLTVDARVQKHKNKFETDYDSCHTLHTGRYTSTLLTAPENSCILSSRLMTTPCARNATISRNSPIRTALTFQCRHRRLYL